MKQARIGDRPTVVVVGAGFGGLQAVRTLKRAPVRTVLVDQHNFHLFTPLLYQVASALLDPSEIAHPTRSLLRGIKNAEFRLGRVTGLDLARRRLETDDGELAYDYLILAAGSVTNFYDNSSLERTASPLKDLGDGLALRNQILANFERAAWTTDPAERRALMTFAVVGGGPTGVEYAGALSELINLVLRKDFPELDLRQVEIILVEAVPSVLTSYPARLQRAAVRTLARKGIRLIFNAPVKEAADGWLRLGNGEEIRARTIIWTAGVKGASLAAAIGQPLGRQGRVRVDPTLQLPGHPEVFVAGDLAEVVHNGQPLPMVIQPAMQEARCAARNIAHLIKGEPLETFRYRDLGQMATIGRNAAVADIKGIQLSGFLGWAVWLVFHLLQIVDFRSRLVVLINWIGDYFFYDRPVRLIAGPKNR
jgi:NADH dehydrogenase